MDRAPHPVPGVGRHEPGSPGLRRLQLAMTAAGLAAFALLYSTQALLPAVSSAFDVGPATASLTIAVATGAVGITVLPMSAFAEWAGRTRVMSAGLAVACIAVALGAACTQFWELLATRTVAGLALAGVVAVAMGHIGDEVAPSASGAAIGLYVSGTTIGGLSGRVVPAAVEEFADWRWALLALGLVGALCTAAFIRLVPPSRAAAPRGRFPSMRAAGRHLRDPGIVRLCVIALLLMGGFVAIYNYLTYRLTEAPFGLSKALVGLIFVAYLAGTVASVLAGRLGSRLGRRSVLGGSVLISIAGLAITLPDNISCVIVGLVVFTTGFFGCHATASAWVTTRVATNTSQASALYLTAYYIGSSIGGSTIGLAWVHGGWTATAITVAICYVVAGVIALGIGPAPTDVTSAQAVGGES